MLHLTGLHLQLPPGILAVIPLCIALMRRHGKLGAQFETTRYSDSRVSCVRKLTPFVQVDTSGPDGATLQLLIKHRDVATVPYLRGIDSQFAQAQLKTAGKRALRRGFGQWTSQ